MLVEEVEAEDGKYLKRQRLDLFLQQRNSAKRAMWSEDHSGEGSAVSFLKLSSSSNSNNDSTTKESAETTNHIAS